jgi:uncharacterized damage-inducible protein DinB
LRDLCKREKTTMDSRLAEGVRGALTGELEALRDAVRELAAPLGESEFWAKPVDPGNSVGHLVLHLTGNLNHFVGGQLGGTGYVRDREREFTETEVPGKDAALAGLDDAVATFRRVVGGLSEQQLLAPHPEARFGTVLEALVHLLAHFALHRGQMSYLVRLVKPQGVPP